MSRYEDDNDQYGLTLAGHNRRINLPDQVLGMFQLEEEIDRYTAELEAAAVKLGELTSWGRWWEPPVLMRVISTIDRRNCANANLRNCHIIRDMIARWDDEQQNNARDAAARGEQYSLQLSPWVILLAQEYRADSFNAYTDAQMERDIATDYEPMDEQEDEDAAQLLQ